MNTPDPIRFNCPSCGQKFRVPSNMSGKPFRCPNDKCRLAQAVPIIQRMTSTKHQLPEGITEIPSAKRRLPDGIVEMSSAKRRSAVGLVYRIVSVLAATILITTCYTTLINNQHPNLNEVQHHQNQINSMPPIVQQEITRDDLPNSPAKVPSTPVAAPVINPSAAPEPFTPLPAPIPMSKPGIKIGKWEVALMDGNRIREKYNIYIQNERVLTYGGNKYYGYDAFCDFLVPDLSRKTVEIMSVRYDPNTKAIYFNGREMQTKYPEKYATLIDLKGEMSEEEDKIIFSGFIKGPKYATWIDGNFPAVSLDIFNAVNMPADYYRMYQQLSTSYRIDESIA